MKRKIKIGNAMAAAVLSGLFFAVSPMTAAEKMSNAEKIAFIDRIIETKLKESGGSDVSSEVLDAVAEKIPLDGEETPESVAIINKIKQKVRQEYPLSDQDLTERYMPKAESLYPIYKPGDNANIIFFLHGKKFHVSGPYYRSDHTYVWVGSKKILKSTIPSDYACRFDVKLNEAKRSGYVNSKIYDYHRRADSFEQKLLAAQHDNIEASRNKFKINGKWQTARVVTEQKYAAADQQITNVILAVQRTLAKKFDIQNNEKCCQLLETLIRNYPNHKYAENAKELLEKAHEQKIVAVLQAVEESPDIESHEKCCQLLESIIREFPDHMHVEKAKELLEKIKREYPIKLASREAVRQIVVDNSNQDAQITIRKLINQGNKWNVFVFPIDFKSKVVRMNQNALNAGRCYQLYKQKKQEADRITHLINNEKAAPYPDYVKISRLAGDKANAMFSAQKDLRQGIIFLAELNAQLIPYIGGSSNVRYFDFQNKDSCNLSNIKGSIILFAYEIIHFFENLDLIQCWYLEYTPGQAIEWKLE